MPRPRRVNLRPIDDNIETDYDDINLSPTEPEVIPEGKIRVENNIDFFNSCENDPDFSNKINDKEPSVDISKYTTEILKLNEKIISLENENTILKTENSKLQSEISELKKTIDNKTKEIMDQKSTKLIQDENDNLLLKNSELELELSKMRCQLRNNITIGKPSPTQVYSREHYTTTPGNVINRKNGYQDWN